MKARTAPANILDLSKSIDTDGMISKPKMVNTSWSAPAWSRPEDR